MSALHHRLLSLGGGVYEQALTIINAAGGVLFDASRSPMTIGRDGTGGAPTSGSVVGRMTDLATGAKIAIAQSDNARPQLTISAGIAYLTFDGIDDYLLCNLGGTTTPTQLTMFAAVQLTGGADFGRVMGAYRSGVNLDYNTTTTAVFGCRNGGTNDLDIEASGRTARVSVIGAGDVVYQANVNGTGRRARIDSNTAVTDTGTSISFSVSDYGIFGPGTGPDVIAGRLYGMAIVPGAISSTDEDTLIAYMRALQGR